jgi:hypothetical protein
LGSFAKLQYIFKLGQVHGKYESTDQGRTQEIQAYGAQKAGA